MPADFMTVNPAVARRLAERSSVTSIAKITYRVAAIAKMTAPGSMKDQIRVTVSPRGGGMGIVISDHPATTFVIHGTRPHVIVARRKKMLKFQIGGTDHFARMVHHPGTKANDFLMKALLAARSF